jgi:hypothetical protein
MVRVWSVCALSLAVGVGAGWALHRSDSADAEKAGPAGAPQVVQFLPAQPQSGAQAGLDLSQLHAAIREELAAARLQGGVQPAGAEQKGAPASAELVAQRREAVQDIEGMIATGEWGNSERAQFQQRFALLDPDQARQVLREVVTALNNGTIHSKVDLPL